MIVTLMIGIPGSGKSTYIKNNLPGTTVVSADHFFTGEDGVYRFDPKKLGEAHGTTLRQFLAALSKGFDIVVDNTNTTLVNLAPYEALASMHGATVRFVHLDVDPTVAHSRCIHGVPLETVVKASQQIASTIGQWPPYWSRPVTIKE